MNKLYAELATAILEDVIVHLTGKVQPTLQHPIEHLRIVSAMVQATKLEVETHQGEKEQEIEVLGQYLYAARKELDQVSAERDQAWAEAKDLARQLEAANTESSQIPEALGA